jgi:hypothetical protein
MMSALDLVLCIFGFNLSPSKSNLTKQKKKRKGKGKKANPSTENQSHFGNLVHKRIFVI